MVVPVSVVVKQPDFKERTAGAGDTGSQCPLPCATVVSHHDTSSEFPCSPQTVNTSFSNVLSEETETSKKSLLALYLLNVGGPSGSEPYSPTVTVPVPPLPLAVNRPSFVRADAAPTRRCPRPRIG